MANPFLRGWGFADQMMNTANQRNLGMLGGALNFQNAQQQQQIRDQGLQQDKAFREGMGALGPNPDLQQAAFLAAQHGRPEIAAQLFNSVEGRKMREAMATQYQAAAQEAIRIREQERRQSREEADARARQSKEELLGIAAGLRQPRQEPAPSFTEIVDPSNPKQMLKIDGRLYKGGGVGSPGVIGIAGKEPGAAKRGEKEEQGIDHLKSELDNLRSHFETLNTARAIPSSERGGMSNIGASIQSSTVGQMAGRAVGTKEQDARNQITSSRLRLLNAIKNATGMSAQQLNSNAELKTWLDSLTDLGGTYESNIGIIDAIENSFLKGRPAAAGGGGGGGNDDPPPGAVRPRAK